MKGKKKTGGEDLGEDHIVSKGERKGGGFSHHRQSIKWDCWELTANTNLLPTRGGEEIIRILQGLIGRTSKFYRDKTDSLRPPPTSPQMITNDWSLKYI